MTQKEKAYFQKFSWFQFYVYKLCMIMCKGWSVCHGWTFLKTWEKNCFLKVTSIYVTALCFMLKSVINSFEIDKSLVGVVSY